MSLVALKARRALQQKAVDFRHKRWLVWKKTRDLKSRREAWLLWQKALKDLHALDNAIIIQRKREAAATHASGAIARSIAAWEGGGTRDSNGRLIFKPYHDRIDPPGVNTQGYGHIEGVQLSDAPWSEAEALRVLRDDLNKKYAPFVRAFAKRFGLKLNQKQFDALLSFVYNLGEGYFFRGHDVGDAAARSDWAKRIGPSFMVYVKDFQGDILQGLVKRRGWEKQLFEGGTYVVNN